MSETDRLRDYAAYPEAHRETVVDLDGWNWRDGLASVANSQRDYDTRRLEGLLSGEKMKPSLGWTIKDRILERGVVDAFIVAVRKLEGKDRRAFMKAIRAKT